MFGRTPKINSYKTVSQFTKEPWEKNKIFGPQDFQRLNRVIGCFNVIMVENWWRQLTYNFMVSSNDRACIKSGHVELDPVNMEVIFVLSY